MEMSEFFDKSDKSNEDLLLKSGGRESHEDFSELFVH
jgi:hypothetical protein